MLRIIVFLVLIAGAALGAAWIAEQHGDIAMSWNGWRIETSLPVFAAIICVGFVAALALWSALYAIWRMPVRFRRAQAERRRARGRHAITQGLIAIGSGEAFAARSHAKTARRFAQYDPLALLLEAQTAQLEGDRETARRAFTAMAERKDTRLLGLRGLFIEAQRRDDPSGAVAIAEEALRSAPGSSWAAQAVLGFRCARGDWTGALAIVDNDLAAGVINKATHKRWRGVLLTARATELETSDRDASRVSIMEAVKLAPTLVPAVALAAKYLSESQQVRRAMRLIEAAWVANPHPDLADAYAHVRLGDSALERLARVEALSGKTQGPAQGPVEGLLAVARAAIDAREFPRARAALAPLLDSPTQRVAMLMAEIARTDNDDDGLARQWTLRAVRAAPDPVWTADGYVSDRWYPVSPVTGRIDAFEWRTPMTALSAKPDESVVLDEAVVVEAEPLPQLPPVIVPPPDVAAPEAANESTVAPPHSPPHSPADHRPDESAAPAPSEPQLRPVNTLPGNHPSPPVFRPRRDFPAVAPTVIPILHAPDDPGIAGADNDDDYDGSANPSSGQVGGWRGFLARWGG